MSTKLTVLWGVAAACLFAACLAVAASDRPLIWPAYPRPIYEIQAETTNVRVAVLREGSPTVVYRDGPYRWIEGRRGERFAFRVTNDNSYPVGVILSADGHSLTAEGRARSDHPAYLVGPYQSITVGIWREDLGGGRELVFTNVDRALAARKGDRRNIGVLGVLVWQLEDRYPPVPMDRQGGARRSAEPGGSADAPGADTARDRSARDRSAKDGATKDGSARPERDGRGIGVGAGRRVTDRTYITHRYRRVRVLDTVPIYYDDRPGLLQAGVNLNQYQPPYRDPYPEPEDRRDSTPFPEGGYQDDYRGVHIPD